MLLVAMPFAPSSFMRLLKVDLAHSTLGRSLVASVDHLGP